ncbi:MAG TPA: DUF6152 family protein [Steroidobacteraceae bacterium]|jgi:hypothetical protein|nr:DUF6152 family protein [Steroidobacteraceae bacterium]
MSAKGIDSTSGTSFRSSAARKTIVVAAVVGALSFAALPVMAHHSASQFDNSKVITIKGVVKEFQDSNPHSWLIVESVDAHGAVTTWSFEAEGPEVLLRAGIRRSDLTPGTSLTVTGHPMRDGRTAATWLKAVRADGKVFDPEQRGD